MTSSFPIEIGRKKMYFQTLKKRVQFQRNVIVMNNLVSKTSQFRSIH